ncbi:pilus assembly PilX N-terminal domain-containing protein [Amphibacillus indicireducens]|uniref:Type 4 fimbrial biogenesis protein PilX N-terminal domain-containing protein n=1 Tax=Amphibacillus indicireducens TaxID=1076330 RepID=A0ABP7VGD3_9BACI
MDMLNKLNVKRYINDETGVSLLIAVMTLLVLSIIGVTLATVTFANVKLTTTDREYQSAYYIAEAGVNETYAQIKEHILDSYADTSNEATFYSRIEPALLEDISESTLTNFERSLGEQPEAHISISKIDDGNPRTYQISSKGKIGQRERTVTKEFVVNWVAKGGGIPTIPEGMAAMVRSKINFSTEIFGDVYIASGESESVEINWTGKIIDGNLYAPEDRKADMIKTPSTDYPHRPTPQTFNEAIDFSVFEDLVNNIPDPPVGLPLQSNIYVSGGINVTKEILTDSYINEIKVTSDRTLTIDTKGKTIDLVVDKFLIEQGHIKIVGGGMLNIYVTNRLSFGSGSSSINKDGETNNINLYYSGLDSISVGGAIRINASFFNKQANLTLTGGHGFTGYVISKSGNITVTGGGVTSGVIIAPYSNMNIQGGTTHNGSIIADKLSSFGGGKIKFESTAIPVIPGGNEGGNDSGGELITPKPNTE